MKADDGLDVNSNRECKEWPDSGQISEVLSVGVAYELDRNMWRERNGS